MTDKEINIAIAESCGWTNPNICPGGSGKNASGYVQALPDYCHDLNAMHEAEETLNETDQMKFVVALDGICQPFRWTTIHALARQRAEAFLRAIGKWKE